MSPPVLIVKNAVTEGPGLLEVILRGEGFPFEVVDLDGGEAFPAPGRYGAVIILGGPDSANDTTEKMQQELQRVRELLALGIPSFGICLGLQLLVRAGGGRVVKNVVREIGTRDPTGHFFTVELTGDGTVDPLLRGCPHTFNVFQLHGETVELTSRMRLLGAGKFCKNQIVRVGRNAYGLQCHLELTAEMCTRWRQEDADLRRLPQGDLEEDFRSLQGEYARVCEQIFGNFLCLAGLKHKQPVSVAPRGASG